MKYTDQIQLEGVVSASVQGASHIREKKPCQDAISIKQGFLKGKACFIASVADGHGGPAYTHSDDGSMLAALAAEHTAVHFIQSGKVRSKKRGEHFAECVRQSLKNAWEESIKQSWQMYHIAPEIIRKHGTTILSILVYDGYVYMAQLGDGDICYLDKELRPVFLVKPEEGPISSITPSLCSNDADRSWNFACIPLDDIRFVVLSTDGLMNSLASNDEYVKLAETLYDYLGRFRPSEIDEVLPGWLSDYSKNGSGDDVSLIGVKLNHEKENQGEENETDADNSGAGNRGKTGGGWPRGSLPCQAGRSGLRFKAIQRIKFYPGTEKYYLLSNSRRKSGRWLRR